MIHPPGPAAVSGMRRDAVDAKATTVTDTANVSPAPSPYNSAIQKVISALQSGVAALPPRGDINQNLQRANALALYMHGLKGTLGA